MASRKIKTILYGCCLVLIIRITLVNFKLGSRNSKLRDTEDEQRENIPKKVSVVKTIQWYDMHHNGNGLRCRSSVVDFKQCKYKNCKVLDHYLVDPQDDTSLAEGPLLADAVVYQGNHIEGLIPPIRRDNDQVFVFAERETWWHLGMVNSMLAPATPLKTNKYSDLDLLSASVPDILVSTKRYNNALKFRSLFNWTMTYRLDSDIPMLYGEILLRTRKPPATYTNLKQVYNDKKADVVWLVSHCITKSKRENYVAELKKYISVDVFGACGDKECPRHGGKTCIDKIIKKYKFVLSFENTFHTDYVTEKLFDWFPRDIIQVVYGMARYDKVAPPNTVINAADFNSPKELADFLYHVGSKKRLYMNYIQNKRNYIVYGHDQMQQRSYCQLCDWLNNLKSHRQSYPSIDKWWQVNDTSPYIKLYNQAVKYDTNNSMYSTVAGVLILGCFTFFCLCICVRKSSRHIVDVIRERRMSDSATFVNSIKTIFARTFEH